MKFHEITTGIITEGSLKKTVTLGTFVSGLQKFLTGNQNYDLVVVSTCDNATTPMTKNLLLFTDHLQASSQNLHLLYIDIDAMSFPETTPVPLVYDMIFDMSSNTYDRLARISTLLLHLRFLGLA